MLKFRMYACCCNTHAHMCTHTHASGSHVCMDRGPCGFGTTQFMCIYVPCLNSRRLNTTCSCEATVCVCRSGARLLYCKTCKHATTKHQHNNIEQQQVQTRSNKKNLNIIEPKKIIKSLVDARQHHQSTGVKKRQKASICVNSCQLTTYDIQRTENKKVH